MVSQNGGYCILTLSHGYAWLPHVWKPNIEAENFADLQFQHRCSQLSFCSRDHYLLDVASVLNLPTQSSSQKECWRAPTDHTGFHQLVWSMCCGRKHWEEAMLPPAASHFYLPAFSSKICRRFLQKVLTQNTQQVNKGVWKLPGLMASVRMQAWGVNQDWE